MHNIKSTTTSIADQVSRIFVKSDMLTTRALVGLSSLIFALLFVPHVLEMQEFHDWFWLCFSLIHAFAVFYALLKDITTRWTFIFEAILGFILWNYIALSLIFNSAGLAAGHFPELTASLSPVLLTGGATWWIIARYPIFSFGRNTRKTNAQ